MSSQFRLAPSLYPPAIVAAAIATFRPFLAIDCENTSIGLYHVPDGSSAEVLDEFLNYALAASLEARLSK